MLPQSDLEKPQKNLSQGSKYLELGFAPRTTLDHTTAACMKGPTLNVLYRKNNCLLSWHSIHLSSTRTGLKN